MVEANVSSMRLRHHSKVFASSATTLKEEEKQWSQMDLWLLVIQDSMVHGSEKAFRNESMNDR